MRNIKLILNRGDEMATYKLSLEVGCYNAEERQIIDNLLYDIFIAVSKINEVTCYKFPYIEEVSE